MTYKNTNKILIAFIFAVVCVLISFGCKDEDKNRGLNSNIKIISSSIDDTVDKNIVPAEGGILYIDFDATSQWQATTDTSWIIPSIDSAAPGHIHLELIVEKNETERLRTGRLFINSGNTLKIFTIEQEHIIQHTIEE